MSPSIDGRRRTFLKTTGAALAGGALAGCTSEGAPDEPSDEADVTVEVGPTDTDDQFVFTPGTDEPLRITPGTIVKFVWKSDTHNIVVERQPDGANWRGTGGDGVYDTGHEHVHTFETEGTYEYVCQPHETLGMTGTVVVE